MKCLLALSLTAALGLAPGVGGEIHDTAGKERLADPGPARAMIRAGDFEGAEAALAALQAEFPENSSVALMRGEILLTLKRLDEAVSVLEACVSAAPELPRAHFQLGTALWASGAPDRALEQFALEIAINDDKRVLSLARQNRSLLFQQQRRWIEAAGEVEHRLLLDPGNRQLYGDIAGIYMQAGRLEEASRALIRGREAGFLSARLHHDLGIRYSNLQSHEMARDAFLESLEIDPDLADAHRSLADTLEQLGDYEGVVQHLRSYLEKRPDSPHAEQIRSRMRRAGGG